MASTVIPPVTRLCNGIIRILGMNPGHMTLQGTNTYLLGTGKKRILLDAGEDEKPVYISNLKSVLQEENATLEHIVITHWHRDHIGGVKDILKSLNYGSEVNIWKFPRTDGDDVTDIPLTYLSDGHELKVEGMTIKAVHTPGHTTDHIIVMDESTGIMFSGDNVLGTGTAVFDDLYYYMKSLQVMIDLNPKVIYPGHGPVVENPVETIRYYIEHRNTREAQILNFLKEQPNEKFTAQQIVQTLYVEVDPKLWPAATVNVLRHLHKLLKEKKVTMADEFWQYATPESSL